MLRRTATLVALTLFAASCDQRPMAPEASPGEDLAADFAHAGTAFSGTATIMNCPPGSTGGTEKVLPTGQILQMGRTVSYRFAATDPRVTGIGEWTVNKKIEADNSGTKIWGKIELVADGDLGVWNLSFHGYRVGLPPTGTVTLEAVGQGKTGSVKGLVAKWTLTMPIRPMCRRVFNTDGRILD